MGSQSTVKKWAIKGREKPTGNGQKFYINYMRSGIKDEKQKIQNISSLKSNLTWRMNRIIKSTPKEETLKGNASCEGNFIGYNYTFARLTNVVINPAHGRGRRGGENCSEVFNQAERDEYFELSFGYFKLLCKSKDHYVFNSKSHLRYWQDVLQMTDHVPKSNAIHHGWTIAVVRYEYANLYHTMTDFYNSFYVARLFKMKPGNITILWLDGHPAGALDESWNTLFGRVLRAGDIKQPEMFSHMIWGIMGYNSFLNNHLRKNVPYLEEFRSFFLTQHGLQTKSELLCAKLNIMFLWRRDYLAHPRNPSGSVSRKIKNEIELLESAKKLFKTHNVFGIQLDKMSMIKQLETIAGVDILIGMHGAGLTHTLFLPKHAGLIELYPTYWSNSNRHFVSMAMWRKLHYLSWVNTDYSKELPNDYTVVDVKKVTNMISEMVKKICL